MPPGSDSKLESLRKILEQEETSSFPDTTVIGGLDRFLTRWADELKPAVEGLNSYSVLTPPQRAEWAGRAREKMASTGPAADTRTPATRSRQVRRAAKPRPTALALDDDVTRLKGISTWIWVYTVLRGQSNHCGLDVAAVGWRRERQFQVCLFQYHVYLPLVWSFVRGSW